MHLFLYWSIALDLEVRVESVRFRIRIKFKTKTHQSHFKIIAFNSWKISLVLKFDLNLILIRILNRSCEKPYFKNLRDLCFELKFKITSIQKSQNSKA
jgi:hypothetical protein